MPPNKRKLDNFDPNKSDSDDENFAPGAVSSPRKAARKSNTQSRTPNNKRRKKNRNGSDIDEDDLDLSIDGFDEFQEGLDSESESEVEMEPRRRAAAAKVATYEEPSDEEITERSMSPDTDPEDSPRPAKKPRTGNTKIITLKISSLGATPQAPARTTRAGSRGNLISEPISAGLPPRRATRATSQDPTELVSLSNSGRHVIAPSKSPEALPRPRSRGAKGLKKPISMVKEEVHETSSYEQNDGGNDEDELAGDTQMVEADADADADADAEGEAEVTVENTMDEIMATQEDEGQGEPSSVAVEVPDDDDEDDGPITRRTRNSRTSLSTAVPEPTPRIVEPAPTTRRLTRNAVRKTGAEQSSDFEPVEESAEELSASDTSPSKAKADSDDSPRRGRAGGRAKSRNARSSRRASEESDDGEDELDQDELAEEAMALKPSRRRKAQRDHGILYERPSARVRKPVDYTIKPMDAIYAADEDADEVAPTPSRKSRGGGGRASQPWERTLYTTYGPFGGAGGPTPVIGGPWGTGATGGVDSDSSDEEGGQRPNHPSVAMTPTSAAMPGGLLPGMAQANPGDVAAGGTPANFGRVKSQKALADADPLGVDQNVDFSKVGGLAGHIDQLKEMVQMPLLYPELFLKFHVTPPRGVLFHGPPGTGKTLLARALAASVGEGGQKITFYMRKGADALSKWVGEAERQLRLLFEEARKTQPSIIFFDEIDGLAPVRSSKQEQIHASIVSTLLALMDGMDGRGQVIVIGATNRPDNIDPALRRPGRFDREFYFPLPDLDGRKSIINIHTEDWGIDERFKESLAHATKGYGGADLRALCTEAALNAIQRTFPQIYSSNQKFIVDPDKIKITAKDFMLSIKKMVPSSERATSSGASPLPKTVEPLLRAQLKAIENILDGLIPIKKKVTALQEAMFEQYDDADQGFGRETLQQDFEKSRVFRPRLLIAGQPGMGQGYLGGALLNHFEGLHVQNFDLPTIFADSARSAETAIVQLFAEVKRHKPSVIYLPGIDTWWHTLSDAVITTFLGLLRAIPPTDPVLVLGITDSEPKDISPDLLKDLFGFSKKNQFVIERPTKAQREEFFSNIATYILTPPKDFPDPVGRKLRVLEPLEVAPPPPPRVITKEEIKAVKKRDHQILNALKITIQPIIEQIHRKYKKFRNPVIMQSQIQYLYDEQDPNFVRPDVVQFRPFELEKDKDGIMGLRETSSGKFFYNLETTTIEERLSNGFYARPKDFVADIRSLAKDARQSGDKDRILRANELLANVEVDLAGIEAMPGFADCENVYQRQLQRAKEKAEKMKKRAEAENHPFQLAQSDLPQPGQDAADTSQSGPIILGEPVSSRPLFGTFADLNKPPSSMSNGYSAHSNAATGGFSMHRTSKSSTSPSRNKGGEDVQMGGTSDSQSTPHFQVMPPPISQRLNLSHGKSQLSSYQMGGGSISQTSGFQQIPHDRSPTSLLNDASTTTSGKDPSSKRTSEGVNTQLTNGGHLSQQFSPTHPISDSQLQDTQRDPSTQGGTSSEREWLHSQAHGLARGQAFPSLPSSQESQPSQNPPVPLFPKPANTSSSAKQTSVHGHGLDGSADEEPAGPPLPVLANPLLPFSSPQNSSSPLDALVTEDQALVHLYHDMVRQTSGCSIEQLEQINRELMDAIWRERGEGNRVLVAVKLKSVFEETMRDIEEVQGLGDESLDSYAQTQYSS